MHQKARPEPIDLMWIIRHQQLGVLHTSVSTIIYSEASSNENILGKTNRLKRLL